MNRIFRLISNLNVLTARVYSLQFTVYTFHFSFFSDIGGDQLRIAMNESWSTHTTDAINQNWFMTIHAAATFYITIDISMVLFSSSFVYARRIILKCAVHSFIFVSQTIYEGIIKTGKVDFLFEVVHYALIVGWKKKQKNENQMNIMNCRSGVLKAI